MRIDWDAVAAVVEASAALVSACAWPIVVAMIVYAFRTDLRTLVQRLRSLKGGGVETSFDEAAAKVDAEAARAEAAVAKEVTTRENPNRVEGEGKVAEAADEGEALPPPTETPPPDDFTAAESIIEASPEGAVMLAYRALNLELERLAARRGVDKVWREYPGNLGIEPSMWHLLIELRQLRNSVAHTRHNVSPEGAASFVRAARTVRDHLRDLAPRIVYRVYRMRQGEDGPEIDGPPIAGGPAPTSDDE